MPKIDYSKLFTRRKDGLYCATYTDENGKRHYVYDRDPKRLYEKMQQGSAPTALTFARIAEAWKAEHDDNVEYKTRESCEAPYRRAVERFGNREPSEITATEITAYLKWLGDRGYGKRTVQLHRSVINMIYDRAVGVGDVPYNPCACAKLPNKLKHGRRELPPDEALDAVKNGFCAPFGLFAGICLYSGLRRGEALALRYEDIDRDRKIIHVSKAVEFVGETAHIKEPKTENGYREAILLDVLAEHIPKKKTGLIFCREDGKPLSKTQYRRKWKAYCDAIGYQITAHQLRHGFATILYEAGIADKDAQELLGHSRIELTRNVYTHIRQSRKQETAEILNAFVVKNVV